MLHSKWNSRSIVIATAGVLFPCLPAVDAATRDLDAAGKPVQPMAADPAIVKALDEISAQRIQHTIEKLVSFHNRDTLSSMNKDLPEGQGVSAAADWIESELKEYSAACGGCLEVKRDTFTEPAETGPNARIPQPTVISNVYAVLRGTDLRGTDPGRHPGSQDPSPGASGQAAQRMILVTGHYDSRNTDVMDTHGAAPGANDDASGVAVSLECARVLSKLKLPATLVFAAVAGEEQGLNGSKHLAALAKQEGWQLEAVLNNDIVGGNTTPGDELQDKSAVRVFSESIPGSATPEEIRRITGLGYESDSSSRELARAVVDVAETYSQVMGLHHPPGLAGHGVAADLFHPVLEFRRDRFLRGGDHTSFNQQGFAAVRFTEWREDFHHQHQNVRTENGVEYGDLLKFVDFGYVTRVARLNAATMATLASAPPEPVNPKVLTRNLDNNTQLTWDAAPGAPADSRYEIVWREMTAPDWQYSLPAADAAKLPEGSYSGDASGHFSAQIPVSKDNALFGIRAIDGQGHRSPAVVPLPGR
jgi:hypothetical protein